MQGVWKLSILCHAFQLIQWQELHLNIFAIIQILPADYPGFLIAMLPPGAFFVLGLLIAGRNWLDARANQRLREKRLHEQLPPANSLPA